MRARVALVLSIGLNFALAAALFFGSRRPEPEVLPPPTPEAIASTQVQVRTNVVVRRQNLTWDQIESEDYPTYIANLRAIGCPPATIRDIIVADVNELFRRRRAREIVNPAHQWWRADPDPDVLRAAQEKADALDKERRDLLTRLLGPDWDVEARRLAERQVEPIDTLLSGPVLGEVTPEVKRQVERILAESQRRLREAFPDGQVDPVEWARWRKQTRDELARVLTPEQYEEYLLRYSENAQRLREQTRGLSLSPEDFRKLFRATDPFDLEIQLHYSGDDPANARRRRELLAQRDAAIEQALGKDLARTYRLNQDPLFRQARATVEQLGGEAEAVLPLYQIYQATQRETQRIQADLTLTAAEREEQLHLIQLDQERAVRQIVQSLQPSAESAERLPPP